MPITDKGRSCSIAGLLCVAMLTFGSLVEAAQVITRTRSFDYDPITGLLKKEVAEPTNAAFCVVTEYIPDAHGRPERTITRNCAGVGGTVPGALQEASSPPAAAAFPARAASSSYGSNADKRFITATTNPLGHTTTYSHDPRSGSLVYSTDPNGLGSSASYDYFGRKQEQMGLVWGPGYAHYGRTWTYEYCAGVAFGTRPCPTVEGATPAYAVTSRAATRAVDIRNPNLLITTQPYGFYIRTYHDSLGRTIRTESETPGGLTYQDTKYNPRGLIEKQSRPYFSGQTAYWVTYEYDTLGRVIREDRPTDTAASGAVTTTSYSGLYINVTDPAGNRTVTQLNPRGLVARVIDADVRILNRSYDAVGNLVKVQDPLGNVLSTVYDQLGHNKIAIYDPDLGVWGYCHDALGQLKARQSTVMRGSTTPSPCPTHTGTGISATPVPAWTTFAYDTGGRLRQRVEPDATTTWSFDANASASTQPPCNKATGQLCEVSGANGYNRRINYDDLGRFSTATTNIGNTYTTSTTYSGINGLPYEITYPSGLTVRRNYDRATGVLRDIVDTRNGTVLWGATGWDAEQRVTQYTQGPSATSDHYFPGSGRLNTSQTGSGGTVVNLVHSHDRAGRLTTRFDLRTGVNATYAHDNLNRLASETRSGGALSTPEVLAWEYDAIGNIKSRTEDGLTQAYNYNSSGAGSLRPHAVASVSGIVSGVRLPTYQYDANGNLRSGGGRTIEVTSFDKVASVTSSGARLEYLYGPDQERVQERYYRDGTLQRTTAYLNPDQRGGLFYEHEYGLSGTKKKHYVQVAENTVAVIVCTADPCTNVANTTTQYLHRDHLGSISAVTNATGDVVERMAYEPFGKRRRSDGTSDPTGALAATSIDRGYTGHEHMDEVGLVNMNGRVYDPGLARFISADPLVTDPSDAQSYNRYSYVHNGPLDNVDPSGFSLELPGVEIIDTRPPYSLPTVPTYTYVYPSIPQYQFNPNPGYRYVGVGLSYANFSNNSAFGGSIFGSNYNFLSGPDGGGFDIPGRGAEDEESEFSRFVGALSLSGTARQYGLGLVDKFVKNNKGKWGGWGWLAGIAERNFAKPDESANSVVASVLVEGTGLASGAGIIGMTKRASIAAKETTTLYRAVTQAELKQIQKTGAFEAGANSLGGKWFAETADHARQWGNVMNGKGASTILEVQLPRSQADQLMRMERLDGIGPARYGELEQLRGAIIKALGL